MEVPAAMDMPAIGDVAPAADGLPWPRVRAIVTPAAVPPATRTSATAATSQPRLRPRRRLRRLPPDGPGSGGTGLPAGGSGGVAATEGQLAVGAAVKASAVSWTSSVAG